MEIISRCHYEGNARSNPKSKEFYRNLIASLLSVARNDKFVICDDKSKDELFSRNDYGKDFIFGFWNNSNFGFLFNKKIKKNLFRRRKTQ